jgi:formate dehydrogenase assembly factor FdhD
MNEQSETTETQQPVEEIPQKELMTEDAGTLAKVRHEAASWRSKYRDLEKQSQETTQRLKQVQAAFETGKRTVLMDTVHRLAGKRMEDSSLADSMLDLSGIEVRDDLTIDETQISQRIDALVKEHPTLSRTTGVHAQPPSGKRDGEERKETMADFFNKR